MLEPGDPGRPLAQLAGPVAGRQDHDGGAVGDRRAVVRAQRVGDVGGYRAGRSTDHLAGDQRPGICYR